MMNRVSLPIVACFVLWSAVSVPTDVVAQAAPGAQPSDARWTPWLGCWSPVALQPSTQDVQVCIVPTEDGSGVRMATFAADQSVLDESVIADGASHAVTEGNCEGSRQTRWAANGPRLLTSTELTCQGQASQQTSGVSTLIANRWLDIQVSGPAGRESVRIRRYARSAQNPPAAVAAMVAALPLPPAVAMSSLTPDDVIEAAQSVSQKAVEAWLVETEPHVAINRQALRRMSDAHVPEPVIDLLVALAYPRRFEVRTPSYGGGGGGVFIASDRTGLYDFAGPWAVGYDPYMQCYAPFVGWCAYGAYDYGLYDYGWGYYGGGSYFLTPLPPLAPVPPIAPGTQGHGQVVNGYGYTQVTPREAVAQGGDGRSSSGSTSTSGGNSGGSSGSSGGGSAASPGGYSSGGSGGSGVTAVPR